MADIEVKHWDETNVKIICDLDIAKKVHHEFSFYAKNFQFHPKFKAKIWDGKISLFKSVNRMLPKGLVTRLVEFAESKGYSIEIDSKCNSHQFAREITDDNIIDFYNRIEGPFEPLDTQLDAVSYCLNNTRAVILAPTANGKSYIIHGLAAFFALQKKKVLIIVDRSQLVQQLKENINDEYGGSKYFKTAMVYDDDLDLKTTDVYLTTWQSCYENPEKWFKQFDVLIGDELHKFKAKSIQMINEKIGHIGWRYGLTATLDNDSVTDRLTIIGMFGPTHKVATIKDLIESGVVARPTIYMIKLEYTQAERLSNAGKDYKSELKYLEQHEKRSEIIVNLVSKLKGNTLVSFKSHKHGVDLHTRLTALDKAPFYANHTVSREKRIEISKTIDQMTDATAVVSIGTFSTGINIKRINNLVNATLLKSAITVPQLIGRTLRLAEGKTTSNIFDFGDDLSTVIDGKMVENLSLRHFNDRMKIYRNSGFKIVERTITIE